MTKSGHCHIDRAFFVRGATDIIDIEEKSVSATPQVKTDLKSLYTR